MNRDNVVVTFRMNEKRRELLKTTLEKQAKLIFLSDMPSGLREQTLAEANILFSWLIMKELGHSEFSLLKNARLIQLLSAGMNRVPFDSLFPSIIVGVNVWAYAEAMAEHILAMALALAKNLVKEHHKLAQGEFNQANLNRMLRGSICGILGLGGIGRSTAHLMRSLGMRIYAINTTGKTSDPVDFIGTINDLEYVLTSSDVVVISMPLTKATRNLVGKRELAWMKPDAMLINVARGDIINEAALYNHLTSHPNFTAGLDAWWVEPLHSGEFRTQYPFFSLPNVLGSPHNSASVPGSHDQAIRKAAENINRFLLSMSLVGVAKRDDYV